MSALEQMTDASQNSKKAGLAKVASTNVDAVIAADAAQVKAKLQRYVTARDKFIGDALGVTTIEGGNTDPLEDYNSLFQ